MRIGLALGCLLASSTLATEIDGDRIVVEYAFPKSSWSPLGAVRLDDPEQPLFESDLVSWPESIRTLASTDVVRFRFAKSYSTSVSVCTLVDAQFRLGVNVTVYAGRLVGASVSASPSLRTPCSDRNASSAKSIPVRIHNVKVLYPTRFEDVFSDPDIAAKEAAVRRANGLEPVPEAGFFSRYRNVIFMALGAWVVVRPSLAFWPRSRIVLGAVCCIPSHIRCPSSAASERV